AAEASPGGSTPASAKKRDGLASRYSDHGNKTRNGVITTIAAWTGLTGHSQRRAASTTIAKAEPNTHSSGTNAAARATSRPVAHADRCAARGGAVSIRAALSAISGSITNANAVPRRPAAIAPMATGKSAYA